MLYFISFGYYSQGFRYMLGCFTGHKDKTNIFKTDELALKFCYEAGIHEFIIFAASKKNIWNHSH